MIRLRPVSQLYRFVAGLCLALAMMHGNLLVHRDLKPQNLMVDATAKVGLSITVWSVRWSG